MDDRYVAASTFDERKEEIEYIGSTAQQPNGFQVSSADWSIWPPGILLT